MLLTASAFAHAAQVDSLTAAAKTFVEEARVATRLPLESLQVRTIGSTERASNAIIPLILAGLKTGTFSLASDYANERGGLPKVGDLYLVTHFDGRPAFIYRLTEVELVPFGKISTSHVAVEGPTLREIEPWRKVHATAWEPVLAKRGETLTAETPVAFQRFVVVYPQRPSE